MILLELFCHLDDFWFRFAKEWEAEQLQSGEKHRRRAGQIIVDCNLIIFYQSTCECRTDEPRSTGNKYRLI